jgi:uncharacterized protein (TIGR00369 family)
MAGTPSTPDAEHFRKLERAYLAAPTNRYYRPSIRIGAGTAEIEIAVRDELYHAADAVHGSVYFKALDDAAFFAVNSVVEDVFVLTASFHIDLLRPVSAGRMRASGRLVHRSRRRFIAEAEMTDSKGRLLARGQGTFMRSSIRLTPDVGYE